MSEASIDQQPPAPAPEGSLPLAPEIFAPLFELLAGRKVYYHEPPGNIGDALIHAGASQLFAHFGVAMVELHEADALVFGGGGNWGLYPEARASREAVLAAKPDHDIPLVVFPQTIHSLDEPIPERASRFFVREKASLERVPGACLAPDTAMAFDPGGALPAARFERGVLLRRDKEGLFVDQPSLGDPITMVGGDVPAYIRAAAAYGHLFTDRLHFAIAGLLAGREVTILPNFYHKNRSMWESWLEPAGCQWADKAPDSKRFVEAGKVETAAPTPGARVRGRGRGLRHEQFPSIAITMCVHNEDRFLEENLRYHHALGVGRAYVFLDECTDRSAEILRLFPWVEAIERPCPPDVGVLHVWQNACTDDALARARAEGYEWLLHIDPDEFAFAGNPLPEDRSHLRRDRGRGLVDRVLGQREHWLQYKGHLGRMLASVPDDIAQVILRPKESLPVLFGDDGEAKFWENPYFQDKKPLRRPVLDPIGGETRELDTFLGHNLGKSFIRTSVAARALNPHRWTASQEVGEGEMPLYFPLPKLSRGWHYHYALVSPKQWLKKYRRESRLDLQWEDGRDVEFPKGVWRVAGGRMSPEEADEYLRDWVFLDEAAAERYVQDGQVFKETYVSGILNQVCQLDELRGKPHTIPDR